MTNFPEASVIEASRIQREALAAPKMTVMEAVSIVDDAAETVGYSDDVETRRDAWQLLIDSGYAWVLPGRYGRTAAALIAAGECTR